MKLGRSSGASSVPGLDAALLTDLLESAPDALVIVDAEGRIVFVNSRMQELFGYTRDELVDQQVELLVPDRQRDAHLLHRRTFSASPTPRTPLCVKARRKDGSEVPIDISLSPLRANGGMMVACLIRDVTEREHVSEELRRSESLFRGLLEASPDAIVIVDSEARITLVNGRTEELFGYERGELIGKPVETLLPERHRERHRDHRSAYMAEPTARPMGVGLELAGRRKDGTEFPVDISLSPYAAPDGVLVVSAVRDVTERERVSEELRRSESLFRGLLEASPDAIVIVDSEARITLVNGRTEELFGYERGELIGQPVEMLVPARHRERHQGHRAVYLAEPTARPMGVGLELAGRRKDGTEFPVDISLSPYAAPDGVLVVSAVRDATEQRLAEQEIRQYADEARSANAAKSEFLSRMSHELRTPLNSILGFAQVLELDELTSDQRVNVGYIVRAGRHLLSLINEVLDMAQIEAGRLDLSLEPVALEAVIGEALELIMPLAQERAVQVRPSPPDDAPVAVLADQQRLLQVLLNLIGNAVKYGGAGTLVEVAWAPTEDERVRIDVRDSGPGIPSNELDRIFEPFERLDVGAGAEGSGIGLALVRSLVEAMGGSVSVVSAVGAGTVFTVELPAVEAEHVVSDPAHSFTQLDGGSRMVLHVEDNLVGQRLVERILRSLRGVQLMSASQGTMAIEFARRYRPDVILLDLHLPDLGGEEVLRRLRSHEDTQDIPVVVVSADTSRDAAERMLREGARTFLTKPIDADVLLAVVDEITRVRE